MSVVEEKIGSRGISSAGRRFFFSCRREATSSSFPSVVADVITVFYPSLPLLLCEDNWNLQRRRWRRRRRRPKNTHTHAREPRARRRQEAAWTGGGSWSRRRRGRKREGINETIKEKERVKERERERKRWPPFLFPFESFLKNFIFIIIIIIIIFFFLISTWFFCCCLKGIFHFLPGRRGEKKFFRVVVHFGATVLPPRCVNGPDSPFESFRELGRWVFDQLWFRFTSKEGGIKARRDGMFDDDPSLLGKNCREDFSLIENPTWISLENVLIHFRCNGDYLWLWKVFFFFLSQVTVIGRLTLTIHPFIHSKKKKKGPANGFLPFLDRRGINSRRYRRHQQVEPQSPLATFRILSGLSPLVEGSLFLTFPPQHPRAVREKL